MFLTLTVLGVISGLILAGVFRMADPLIKANKEKELKSAIFTVLPGARDYRTIRKTIGKGHGKGKEEEAVVYVGLGAEKTPIGIAFKADGNGFQGNVAVMVGLDLDYLKLKGIEVLDQVETPGLGNRIVEPQFKDQFKGVEVKPKIEYIKYRKPEKPNQIQAITGATISSDAVVSNINRAVKRVTGLFKKEDIQRAVEEPGAVHETLKEKTDGS